MKDLEEIIQHRKTIKLKNAKDKALTNTEGKVNE
jgi:hypothetical protein